jgi:hypothetical protein
VDLLATEPGRDPRSHLRPRPKTAFVRGIAQPIRQRHHHFRRQDCRSPSITASLVAQRFWPDRVVTRNKQFDPARHEPQDIRHFGDAPPFGKKPYRLKMALGHRLRGRAVTLLKFPDTQML